MYDLTNEKSGIRVGNDAMEAEPGKGRQRSGGKTLGKPKDVKADSGGCCG